MQPCIPIISAIGGNERIATNADAHNEVVPIDVPIERIWNQHAYDFERKNEFICLFFTFAGMISDITTNGIGNIPHEPRKSIDDTLTNGTQPNNSTSNPCCRRYV